VQQLDRARVRLLIRRDTANWPEPAHRIADRQQRIRVDAGRQAERGLGFFLELNALAASSMFAPRDAFLGLRDRAGKNGTQA
jgi:hypothetical protein